MIGEKKFTLTLTNREQNIIAELMRELDNCGIEMNDIGYMDVCRAIKNKETTVDEIEEQFCIEYVD